MEWPEMEWPDTYNEEEDEFEGDPTFRLSHRKARGIVREMNRQLQNGPLTHLKEDLFQCHEALQSVKPGQWKNGMTPEHLDGLLLRFYVQALAAVEALPGREPRKRRSAESVGIEAACILLRHPDATDSEVAQKMGLGPSTLSRNRLYRQLAPLVREHGNLPKGFLKSNGDRIDPEGQVDYCPLCGQRKI